MYIIINLLFVLSPTSTNKIKCYRRFPRILDRNFSWYDNNDMVIVDMFLRSV